MSTTRDYLEYLSQTIDIAPVNSEEEYQAAGEIESLMQAHGLETRLQEFEAPAAGRLPHRMVGLLLFLGVFLAGLIGTAASTVGIIVVLIASIVLALDYFGIADPLSMVGGKIHSQNVIGVHRATGPLVVKGARPIVIVAHYDTPRENILFSSPFDRWQSLLRKMSPQGTALAALFALMQVMGFIPLGLRHILWVVALIASLPLLLIGVAALQERFAPYTEGSNDNKSGVAALLGVMSKVHPGDDVATGYSAQRELRDKEAAERARREAEEAAAAEAARKAAEEAAREQAEREEAEKAAAAEAAAREAAEREEAERAAREQAERDAAQRIAQEAQERHKAEQARLSATPEYEQGEADEEPSVSAEPVVSEEEVMSEVPVASEETMMPAEPVASEVPVTSEDMVEPGMSADTTTAEEPGASAAPITTTASTAAETEGEAVEDTQAAFKKLAAEGAAIAAAVATGDIAHEPVVSAQEDERTTTEGSADGGALEEIHIKSDTPDTLAPEDEPSADGDEYEEADEDEGIVEHEETDDEFDAVVEPFEQDTVVEPAEPFEEPDRLSQLFGYSILDADFESISADVSDSDRGYTEDVFEENTDVSEDDIEPDIEAEDTGAEDIEEEYAAQEDVEEGHAEQENIERDNLLNEEASTETEALTDTTAFQAMTGEEERITGVRHGKEVLESLHILPDDCEIVYNLPPEESRVYEDPHTYGVTREEDLATVDSTGRYHDTRRDVEGEFAGAVAPRVRAFFSRAREALVGRLTALRKPSSDNDFGDQPFEAAEEGFGFNQDEASDASNVHDTHVEDTAYDDDYLDDFEEDDYLDAVIEEEPDQEIAGRVDEPNEPGMPDDEEEPLAPSLDSTSNEGSEEQEEVPKEQEDASEKQNELTSLTAATSDDVPPSADAEDNDATRIYTPLQSLADGQEVDEQGDSKDASGLDMLATDSTVIAARTGDAHPQPKAPDDPDWGKSNFKPQVSNVARRAVLFDLPDPLRKEEEVDPLSDDLGDTAHTSRVHEVAEEAQHDRPNRVKGLFHRRADEEGQESLSEWLGVEEDFDAKKNGRAIRSWSNFNDDDSRSDNSRNTWKGGAARRGDLRVVEGAAEDDVRVQEDLREAILSLGDDALIAHDIWFVALGGSYAEHAGMRAFLAENRKSIRGAFVINVSCIGAGELTMLTHEGLVGSRRADRRMGRLITKIAEDLHIDLARARHDWEDTDATPAMCASMRATTICGLTPDGAFALSQVPDDEPDQVDPAQTSSVAELIAELIRRS